MNSVWKTHAKTIPMGHFSPEKVPWRRLGQYLYRIIEDGSSTQMRISAIESLLPPHTTGPVFHFHEMHDECFIVKSGVVRFHSPGRPDIDAKAGDFITIPTRLPHRFSNPFDEEGVFINLNTPGFYVRYFEHLEAMIGEGKELTPEVNRKAMMRFATVPLTPDEARELEEENRGGVEEARNGELTNGATNGASTKNGVVPELDVASNGGKGVSESGLPV